VIFTPSLNGEPRPLFIDAYPMAGQMLSFHLHHIYTLAPEQDHMLSIKWRTTGGIAQCYTRSMTVILF
jgi:hypothetical protein